MFLFDFRGDFCVDATLSNVVCFRVSSVLFARGAEGVRAGTGVLWVVL